MLMHLRMYVFINTNFFYQGPLGGGSISNFRRFFSKQLFASTIDVYNDGISSQQEDISLKEKRRSNDLFRHYIIYKYI